jgi:hypothetical protein
VKILLVRIIAKVMETLYGFRQTGDFDTTNAPGTRGPISGVGDEAAVPELLSCSARSVKRDGVEVDAAVGRIANNESGGELIVGRGKAGAGKRIPRQRRVGERDDAIKVVVFPGLLLKQRIYAPAAVDPDADPRFVQGANHLKDVLRAHRYSLPSCYRNEDPET